MTNVYCINNKKSKKLDAIFEILRYFEDSNEDSRNSPREVMENDLVP